MRRAAPSTLLLVLVCAGACSSRLAPVAPPPPPSLDWLLVYWLPYDNDLAGFAPDVLGALARSRRPGVGTVQVVAQVDLPGDDGMLRVEIGPEGRTESRLDGHDDSASASELADLLDWAAARHPARRVAIAILGHSRRLEELSPDTDADGVLRWMTLDDLAPVLEAFRARSIGEVELLFLQTCGKAAVDVAWELRGSARFLLASQEPLGAPNHYYGGALAALDAVPSMDGAALADVIATAERPDMFVGLSLIDMAALEPLPSLVTAAVAESPGALPSRALADRVFLFGGDALVDTKALLSARRARAPAGTTALEALEDLLERDVLVWHRESQAPSRDATWSLPAAWSGRGLWVRLLPAEGAGASLLGELATVDP